MARTKYNELAYGPNPSRDTTGAAKWEQSFRSKRKKELSKTGIVDSSDDSMAAASELAAERSATVKALRSKRMKRGS